MVTLGVAAVGTEAKPCPAPDVGRLRAPFRAPGARRSRAGPTARQGVSGGLSAFWAGARSIAADARNSISHIGLGSGGGGGGI
jgi:hypothetical protein